MSVLLDFLSLTFVVELLGLVRNLVRPDDLFFSFILVSRFLLILLNVVVYSSLHVNYQSAIPTDD